MPTEDEAVWELSDTGLIYVVGDEERAGSALLTLIVEDLDAWAEAAARRGITVDEIDTAPGAVRRTVITDPDGNRIQFGQVLSRD